MKVWSRALSCKCSERNAHEIGGEEVRLSFTIHDAKLPREMVFTAEGVKWNISHDKGLAMGRESSDVG